MLSSMDGDRYSIGPGADYCPHSQPDGVLETIAIPHNMPLLCGNLHRQHFMKILLRHLGHGSMTSTTKQRKEMVCTCQENPTTHVSHTSFVGLTDKIGWRIINHILYQERWRIYSNRIDGMMSTTHNSDGSHMVKTTRQRIEHQRMNIWLLTQQVESQVIHKFSSQQIWSRLLFESHSTPISSSHRKPNQISVQKFHSSLDQPHSPKLEESNSIEQLDSQLIRQIQKQQISKERTDISIQARVKQQEHQKSESASGNANYLFTSLYAATPIRVQINCLENNNNITTQGVLHKPPDCMTSHQQQA